MCIYVFYVSRSELYLLRFVSGELNEYVAIRDAILTMRSKADMSQLNLPCCWSIVVPEKFAPEGGNSMKESLFAK